MYQRRIFAKKNLLLPTFLVGALFALLIFLPRLPHQDVTQIVASGTQQPSSMISNVYHKLIKDVSAPTVHRMIDSSMTESATDITDNSVSEYLNQVSKTYQESMQDVRQALVTPPTPRNNNLPGPKELQYFSQIGQDKYLHQHYFPNKTGGRYIDFGALDGIRHSNTLFFDKYYKWEGILVESNPVNYEALTKSGRNAYLLNGCVGGHPYATSNMSLLYAKDKVYALAFVPEMMDMTLNISYRRLNKEAKSVVKTTVPCYPLNTILDAVGWTYIDYFSLDIEGSEPYVLSALNFERFKFGVITLECNQCQGAKNPRILAARYYMKYLLELNGYTEIRSLTQDYVYASIPKTGQM